MENILSSCFEASTVATRTIAAYSHIIPMVLSLLLVIFVYIKAKKSILSEILLFFIITFCFWLLGDLIIWTSNKYNLIYALWAPLLYIEVIFYILGLYFALVFVQKKDISVFFKIILFLISLPPLILTVMKYSVTGFFQPWCEAGNNNFLDIYKLVIEGLILLVILFYTFLPFFKKVAGKIKRTNFIVLGVMFLFLSAFGITEYISATTGNYELNLYSLFLLPVFILTIIYAVFALDIFNIKIIGSYYLVVGLMILVAGQLFFVDSTANQLLTIVTILVTAGLSVILYRNLRKETEQRVHIEKLSDLLTQSKNRLEETNIKLEDANDKLKSLDKLKTEFLSLASHQLRSPLTAIKGYTSMLLEGDFGEVNVKQKEAIDRVFQSSKHLTTVVEDLLNVAKIEQGGMQYVMSAFDLEKISSDIVKDLSVVATEKGLKLSFKTDKKSPYNTNGDMEKLRQVVMNFIDNSIKYTKKGSIVVKLEKNEETKKIIFSVTDTGMGVSPEIKNTLFAKFSRGDGGKMDATGTGLGLYLAKEIIEAHKGRVWIESPGADQGATFSMELNAI